MRSALLVAALAGCYSPTYVDCDVTCATGMGCPDGLSCDPAVHACRLQGLVGHACGGAAIDAAQLDASFACWHGLTPPTNFEPCAASFPPTIGDFIVNAPVTLDTHDGLATPLATTVCVPNFDDLGTPVCLLHATTITVLVGGVLSITGANPLVMVSDGDVEIDGGIILDSAGYYGGDCETTLDGLSGSFSGAGGGGGGLGDAGGEGGASDHVPGSTPGGAPHGVDSASPLHPGCSGGKGGDGGTVAGGGAGAGGGAIEIAAVTKISFGVSGGIFATGAGGGGGNTNGACSGHGCASGGGGGGAGGQILLEAPSILLQSSSEICAVGGGGGEGADFAAASGMNGGSGPGCTVGLGGYSGATQHSGPGGNGSVGAAGATNGGSGDAALIATDTTSGGGGGGGVGRIRLHATSTPSGGVIVPAPITQ